MHARARLGDVADRAPYRLAGEGPQRLSRAPARAGHRVQPDRQHRGERPGVREGSVGLYLGVPGKSGSEPYFQRRVAYGNRALTPIFLSERGIGERRRRALSFAHEEVDDALEGLEAEGLGDRGTQVRVRVDVVEHQPPVGRLEIFDAADVELARGHDALAPLHRLRRHLGIRIELRRPRGYLAG